MGLLDRYFEPDNQGLAALLGNFGMYNAPSPLTEDQRQAEEARAAAALRLRGGVMRSPQSDSYNGGASASPFDTPNGAMPAPQMYGGQAFGMPQFAQPPQLPPQMPAPQFGGPDMRSGGMRFSPTGPQPEEAANIPQMAAPTAGMPAAAAPYLPPQQPAAPSILERILSGVGRGLSDNSNALLAFGGGTLQGGVGRGFSAMAAASPLDRAARQERQGNAAIAATYQALLRQQLAAGVPPAEAHATALAASQNPEILKTVIGPQFQHTEATGIMGEKTPLVFDPRRGRYFDASGKPYTGAMTNATGEMPTGQEYLDKYVPSQLHASVKAAANYDVPTSGLGSMKQLTPHVVNYDPNFDAANYPAKVALKKSFMGGGNDFKGLEAFNTVGTHMGELMEAAKALNPSDWKIVNNVRNFFSDYVTDNPKLVRFRNALNTTQHELGNAYHAGHITDASLHSFQQAIADNMSTPGLKAAIGEMAGLLGGKISAKEENYNTSFPGKQLPPGFQALNSKTKDAFRRIHDWANDIPESPGGAAGPGGWIDVGGGVRVREKP